MFSNLHQVDLTPALTFVSSPAREIGRQAARRLLTRMQQPELAPPAISSPLTSKPQKRASA
ncbi:substrate-binding domain-containing protein [Aeromonas veronii]|uniref:substrate-binding domain-containing protein n=1 Tax=Aeromonas veronii TaxID=654 RepID=UPI000A4C124D